MVAKVVRGRVDSRRRREKEKKIGRMGNGVEENSGSSVVSRRLVPRGIRGRSMSARPLVARLARRVDSAESQLVGVA